LIASSALLQGCVSRTILSFDDNPKQPLTTMQVMTVKNYFIYKSAEHQFFSCVDKGAALDCKRVCGGNTDLLCPFGAVTPDGATNTSIR
jgi:hypothetical protein